MSGNQKRIITNEVDNTSNTKSKPNFIYRFKYILYTLTALGCFPLKYNWNNRCHVVVILYSLLVNLSLCVMSMCTIYLSRPWENSFGSVMVTQIIQVTLISQNFITAFCLLTSSFNTFPKLIATWNKYLDKNYNHIPLYTLFTRNKFIVIFLFAYITILAYTWSVVLPVILFMAKHSTFVYPYLDEHYGYLFGIMEIIVFIYQIIINFLTNMLLCLLCLYLGQYYQAVSENIKVNLSETMLVGDSRYDALEKIRLQYENICKLVYSVEDTFCYYLGWNISVCMGKVCFLVYVYVFLENARYIFIALLITTISDLMVMCLPACTLNNMVRNSLCVIVKL